MWSCRVWTSSGSGGRGLDQLGLRRPSLDQLGRSPAKIWTKTGSGRLGLDQQHLTPPEFGPARAPKRGLFPRFLISKWSKLYEGALEMVQSSQTRDIARVRTSLESGERGFGPTRAQSPSLDQLGRSPARIWAKSGSGGRGLDHKHLIPPEFGPARAQKRGLFPQFLILKWSNLLQGSLEMVQSSHICESVEPLKPHIQENTTV